MIEELQLPPDSCTIHPAEVLIVSWKGAIVIILGDLFHLDNALLIHDRECIGEVLRTLDNNNGLVLQVHAIMSLR